MIARFIVALACAAALGGCVTTGADSPALPTRYAEVIASPIRTEQDRRMDAERKPAEFLPFTFDDPVPAGSPPLDLVTLILNYHDISYLPVDRKAMNAKLFAALKPGGHFVVIDHSSRPGKGISEGKTLHRIDERVVVDEVRQAGFVLEAEGDFLRNPDDPRDTPSGAPKVPTDKFALRFVKP
jgi:predicted methyltransferase